MSDKEELKSGVLTCGPIYSVPFEWKPTKREWYKGMALATLKIYLDNSHSDYYLSETVGHKCGVIADSMIAEDEENEKKNKA